MDIFYITDWLKNTVLGIIILGAIGSLLSIFIIRLFNYIILKSIPERWQSFIRRRLKHFYGHGYTFGYLSAKNDVAGIAVYLSFHITRIVIYLFFWIFFFNLYFISINFTTQLLTVSSYVSILISFLFLFLAYDEFKLIRFGYDTIISPIIDKGSKRYKEKK